MERKCLEKGTRKLKTVWGAVDNDWLENSALDSGAEPQESTRYTSKDDWKTTDMAAHSAVTRISTIASTSILLLWHLGLWPGRRFMLVHFKRKISTHEVCDNKHIARHGIHCLVWIEKPGVQWKAIKAMDQQLLWLDTVRQAGVFAAMMVLRML